MKEAGDGKSEEGQATDVGGVRYGGERKEACRGVWSAVGKCRRQKGGNRTEEGGAKENGGMEKGCTREERGGRRQET